MFRSLILFHRRLVFLAACFVACLLVLIFQVSRLTLLQGTERFTKANDRLHWISFLPTWRGQITDRKGRVIAEDVASYDVAVDWDLITGARAIRLAIEDARNSVGDEKWETQSFEQRKRLTNSFLRARQEELQHFWSVIALEGNVEQGEVDLRLAQIQAEVEHTAQVVWARQEEVHKQRYGDRVKFKKQPIREQREPHVVLPRVSDETAMKFSLLSEVFDQVIRVQHARQRAYPYRTQNVLVDRSTLPKPMRQFDAIEIHLDGIAELIVGDVRGDVWAEDIDKRPFRVQEEVDLGGYRSGDEVGNRGLESSLEESLRGTRGRVVRHKSGEELERLQPVGGNNVQVTLDIELQARIEAVLSPDLGLMLVQPWHQNKFLPDGTPLRGAVVVLDVETSEVLAMASTPALRDEKDVDGYPWLNRAADGLYPPGSIIKPFILCSAMTDGKITSDESIECIGHFFEGVTDAARCWIYRDKYNYSTHGKLKTVEAIARSCNFFFYELGTRLGFSNLLQWLQRFGMSKPLSAQLTDPDAVGTQGHFPNESDITLLRNRGALAFETVSVSIGQGALTWTPLHAAAAYATLARGGLWRTPTLVVGNNQHEVDLRLDQQSVQLALSGLRDSVTKSYGTGSLIRDGAGNEEPIFNIDGLSLWGKTGTAEAPPYRLNKGSKPVTGPDHSWFLVMASSSMESKPSVVVAVLVEHGGSGGRVAGPIANQVLFALKAEGYLERNR